MDSPAHLVGVAAKTLGLPWNVTPAALAACAVTEQQLIERTAALRAHVRTFSDKEAMAALYGKDVWVAVAPSEQVMPVEDRSYNIAVTVPASGTALAAELWVQPRHAPGAVLQRRDLIRCKQL